MNTVLWVLQGVLAVAFSALLIVMQFGLMLGLFAISSVTIDRTRADVWVGSPDVRSVDLGRPIPESFLARVASEPDVQSVVGGGDVEKLRQTRREALDAQGWVEEQRSEISRCHQVLQRRALFV